MLNVENAIQSIITSAATHCPGAAEEFLKQELRWVFADFFQKTRVWRMAEDITLVSGVPEYPLLLGVAPLGAVAYSLLEARIVSLFDHNGFHVRLHTAPDLVARPAMRGTPALIELCQGDVPDVVPPPGATSFLRLWPTPQGDLQMNVLRVAVAYTLDPAVPNPEYPAAILPYTMALQAGLLARLLNMSARPWYDVLRAREMLVRFEYECSRVRREVQAARAPFAATVRPRRAYM